MPAMMLRKFNQLLVLSIFCVGTVSPALSMDLRSSVIVDNQADVVWRIGSNAVATLAVDPSTPDETLKGYALKLARAVLGNDSSKAKHIDVMFANKNTNSKFKGVSISFEQLNGLSQDAALASIIVVPCERASSMTASEIAAIPALAAGQATASGAQNSFHNERASIVSQLQSLQNKGVGTSNYVNLLNQADDQYKSGHLEAAHASLMKLGSLISQNEERLRANSPKVEPASTAAAAPGKGKHGMLLASDSIASFNGSQAELAERVVRALVDRELGGDAPQDGPFLLERLRIARRFQELQQQGLRIDAYRSFNRDRIEAVVTAKDQRRLPELRDNIKYLEQMIGLPPMQALPKKFKNYAS